MIAPSEMNSLTDIIITVVVMGGILLVSAILTNLFVRKMYYLCGECRNLNAKRRTHCRICGSELVSHNQDITDNQ